MLIDHYRNLSTYTGHGHLFDGDREVFNLCGVAPSIEEKLIKVSTHFGDGFIENHLSNLKIQWINGLSCFAGYLEFGAYQFQLPSERSEK